MTARPPRFVVDSMLGSLARWLRILGYDAEYESRRDDPELVRLARAEDRVLLTRDHGLANRRGVRSLLVESQDLDEQLAQVTSTFPLSPGQYEGRCPVCNTALIVATREEVEGAVPPYVLQHHRRFQRCPGCQRVYWRGSHWRNMQGRLGRSR
jgi:uncharacterized protein with PIN domain